MYLFVIICFIVSIRICIRTNNHYGSCCCIVCSLFVALHACWQRRMTSYMADCKINDQSINQSVCVCI